MTRSRKTPISSFGPEIFEALIQGSRKKFTISTTYRKAMQFRLQIHKLRERMREENHELYPVASRTKVSIAWEPTIPTKQGYHNSRRPEDIDAPVTMTIAPRDSEFTEALVAAGITIDRSHEPKLPDSTIDTPRLDSILKDWDK